MKNLKCILIGHVDFYKKDGKFYLTQKCQRCMEPAYKNRNEQAIRAFIIFKSDPGNNWSRDVDIMD